MNTHDALAAFCRNRQRNAPAGRRVARSVAQQIDHHLLDAVGVAIDEYRQIGNHRRQLVTALRDHGLHRLSCEMRHLPQIQRLQSQLDGAAARANQIAQILDQTLRLPDLAVDHVRDRFQPDVVSGVTSQHTGAVGEH